MKWFLTNQATSKTNIQLSVGTSYARKNQNRLSKSLRLPDNEYRLNNLKRDIHLTRIHFHSRTMIPFDSVLKHTTAPQYVIVIMQPARTKTLFFQEDFAVHGSGDLKGVYCARLYIYDHGI